MRSVRAAAVRMECDGNIQDPSSLQAGLDDHFRRELHSGATLPKPLVQLLREAPQPAIHVVNRRVKPMPGQEGEERIAKPTVKEGHRSGKHPPAARLQPASLDELVSLSKLVDEPRNLEKIVTIVGVAHDDVASSGGGDPPHESAPVAA